MRILTSLAAMCAVLSPVALSAEELAETAARFGALQSASSGAISPSGDKLLFISSGDGSDQTINVVDLNSTQPPQPIITMNESRARIRECQWATDERIVCDVEGMQKVGTLLIGFNRLFALKSDGTDVTQLIEEREAGQYGGGLIALDTEEDGKILVQKQYIEAGKTGSRLGSSKGGLGVELVDLGSGRGREIEKPNKNADAYIADENGRLRIMRVSDRSGGFEGSDVRFLYRSADDDKWLPLSELDYRGVKAVGFRPVAIDSSQNLAYGFENVNGYTALYSIALDGTGTKKLVKAVDGHDVDGLIRIGRSNRVVGVSYVTERRYAEYFDTELAKLAAGLEKALPGTPQITFLDANDDESVLLIQASSDTDPGILYLYEKATGQLGELLPVRDPLYGREMAEMKPVTYKASDGTEIPGYLTLPVGSTGKDLPTVVMPHGGPGARDEWGFDWLAQFFAARGYAVLQPNFRGSAGYGDAWFGENGFQQWEKAVGDVNDAGRWLANQGIADPDRMAVVGWSYGGYAALQSQVVDSDLFKAVVAIAPVTDLELLREENRRYSSFAWVDRMIGNGPHVDAGSPARHADAFKAPVLLFHGSMDQNVAEAHSKLMRDRLQASGKQVEYQEFDGLTHGLVHSQARRIMLKRIGEFLDAELAK